jgi:hypothetical protein
MAEMDNPLIIDVMIDALCAKQRRGGLIFRAGLISRHHQVFDTIFPTPVMRLPKASL